MAKKIKISLFIVLSLILSAVFFVLINIPFEEIRNLPNDIFMDYETLSFIGSEKPFGKFITINYDDSILTSSSDNIKTNLNLKLFNLITIKKLPIIVEKQEVYSSGDTVGFSLNSSGVIVIGSSEVSTENGNVNTLEKSDIKNGDVILEIAGEKVNKITDLSFIVNREQNQGKELEVVLKRKGQDIKTTITPAKDIQTGTYKLGVWVKDDASGVGTLTFVRKDNYRFGALGHAICDTDTKEPFMLDGGDMYNCTVIGLNKGQKGKAGEIKALFIQGKNSIGSVDKNTKYGIFGTFNKEKLNRLKSKETVEVGSRLTAKPGKAKLRVSLDGNEAKDYDIEIIKTNYQHASSEKSMVIRVVDKELLEKTGGIIQGMSGSPILQNGKIIGAVTHVFLSDPTKGFGVYIDWMINE